MGNRRPGEVTGAQPVPAEWTPRRLAAGAPWVQGPRCRARRAAQGAAVTASDTGGGLISKELDQRAGAVRDRAVGLGQGAGRGVE